MSTTTYQRSPAMRRAYREGRAAVADRDNTNPYVQDRDPELYGAWADGYDDELDTQAKMLGSSLDALMGESMGHWSGT